MRAPRIGRLLAVLAILLLVGCGSVRDANTTNFENALRDWYVGHPDRMCIDGAPVSLQNISWNANVLDRQNALVAVGLLSRTNAPLDVAATFNTGAYTTTLYTYQLTDFGEKYYTTTQPGDSTMFCYADVTVYHVTNFTVPGAGGYSTVSYTYKLIDLAGWAMSPNVRDVFPDVTATLDQQYTKVLSANMILTNNGWEVSP